MATFRAMAGALFALLPAGVALPAADEQAVALPPFLVEEAAKGPPWRYTESMGYEILARCNDATTRRVLEVHFALYQLLNEILPRSLRLEFTLPKTLILYDEELTPAASKEVISGLLRDTTAPPAPEFELQNNFRSVRAQVPPRPTRFLPNMRLWDRDAMTVFMITRREDFEASTLGLTSSYIAYLVKGRLPTLPAWFIQGFLATYEDIKYAGNRLDLAPLAWISAAHTATAKKTPGTAPRPLPLEDLFAYRMPPRDPAADFEPLALWQASAELFVRWGLDPAGGARKAAFHQFIERATLEGHSEALFQQCFGLDYTTAQAALTAFLPTAVRDAVVFRPAKLAKLPALALRPATEGQIARIKGDWERLEIAYVKKMFPELAPKYLEQARRTLRRAYDRDDRDPRLLAALGLCEVDAGNPAAAQEFLETAAAIGLERPRANYELGRLRLAQARAQPEAKDGRLSVNQTAAVLTPLFAARAGRPPLPEVYEVIGDTWAASAATPTRGHLAVLDEGVRLFPRRPALVLRTAELHLRNGFRDEAAALVELGTRIADGDALRERAAALQAQLATK